MYFARCGKAYLPKYVDVQLSYLVNNIDELSPTLLLFTYFTLTVYFITVRLSERMGDEAHGKLEVFQPELQSWRPACITNWDPDNSPKAICNFLGYA